MQSAEKLFRATPLTFQGRIHKIQKGVGGTLNSSILDTFYFSKPEFYTNNTKFERERGGRAPLDPTLNPPMLFKKWEIFFPFCQ